MVSRYGHVWFYLHEKVPKLAPHELYCLRLDEVKKNTYARRRIFDVMVSRYGHVWFYLHEKMPKLAPHEMYYTYGDVIMFVELAACLPSFG